MSRAADEAVVILPAHRKRHVFRREIEGTVCIPGAYKYQRGDHKTAVPDRLAGVQCDQVFGAWQLAHDNSFGTQNACELS
ncbi:MAG: hypothetical protein DRQ63_12035 [Gammaproteobacteria bacterium]|nr:MAG: hypothetical protein DRQ63_12035 [Gammaproteobacteria bacterium]